MPATHLKTIAMRNIQSHSAWPDLNFRRAWFRTSLRFGDVALIPDAHREGRRLDIKNVDDDIRRVGAASGFGAAVSRLLETRSKLSLAPSRLGAADSAQP